MIEQTPRYCHDWPVLLPVNELKKERMTLCTASQLYGEIP